jgi:hypothetical protein
MMSVLGAERGYLVVDHCNPESVIFASAHGVEILQEAGLSALEQALHIGAAFWPGRTNFMVYEPLARLVAREADLNGSALNDWMRSAAEIWREASALSFSYGRLNHLLATLEALAAILKQHGPQGSNVEAYSYAVAALLVRFSQYVLFAAADTLGMTKPERETFVAERLTAGSVGVEQTRKMMRSALNLAKAKLGEHGIEPPPNWAVDHLMRAPPYARPFAEVVDRVVADGHRARMLPLALDLRLFGYVGDERHSSGLIKRVTYALPLTGLIRGFAVQSLGLPEEWTQGPVVHNKNIKTVAEESACAAETSAAPNLPGIKI